MKREIVYDPNPAELWKLGAKSLFNLLSTLPGDAPITIGLCGGRSVGGLLQATVPLLQNAPKQLQSRLQFFMLDERVVPLNHADSNFRLVSEMFLSPLNAARVIETAQQHPFEAESATASVSCERYYGELNRFGSTFSIVVLAIGEDGHVAGLFPHHQSLSIKESTFFTFSDSPKPPPHRMTATIPLLQKAKGALLLAIGEGKREAFKRYLDPAVSLEDCPAKLVDSIPSVFVVTDLKS